MTRRGTRPFRRPSRRAALLAALALVAPFCAASPRPAAAQDDAAQKRLNQALAVLRTRMGETSQDCLHAMQRSQETEKQVDEQERINPGDTGRPNPQLDIARDVLGSDYEAAEAVCVPDAKRVCETPDAASAKPCAAFNAGVPGPAPGS